MPILDMQGYCKLTGKTYKQVRSMCGRREGRWRKERGKWTIEVLPGDVIPGVDNESLPQPQLNLNPAPAEGPSDDKAEWELRKLKADAIRKEQQNDAFLFKLLNDFLEAFSDVTIAALQPIQQHMQGMELTREQVDQLNRKWEEFAQTFEERGLEEVHRLFEEIIQ